MRYLYLLSLFAFSSFAQSAVYTWSVDGISGTYPSAVAACSAKRTALTAYDTSTADMLSESTANCIGNSQYSTNVVFGYASRLGDSCPSGQVLDKATGGCGIPQTICEDRKTSGAVKPYKLQGTAGPGQFVTIATGQTAKFFKYFHSEKSICFEGCSSQTSDSKCSIKRDGSFVCVGLASSGGSPCTGTAGSPEFKGQVIKPDLPVPTTTSTNKPCTYVVNGNTSTCQSIKGEDADGQDCGVFNGKSICVSKVPNKYENKIDTTSVKTTSGANTITTKTDTLTATKCVGPNPCTVQITTSTTTTTTKTTGGALVDSSASCVGPACSNTSNPDGNGDGFGDSTTDGTCDGDQCGEGEGNGTGSPSLPDLSDAPSYADSLSSFQTKIKGSPIYSAVGGLSVPSGGSCSFGSAQTFFGAISFDDFCAIAPTILNPLRYLFLAIWAWAAIRLFFTA